MKKARLEQYLPHAAGVVAAVTAGFAPPLHPYFVDGVGIDRSSLIAAGFDFFAVTTPFLFAFYAFAVAPVDGFLAKLLDTRAHRTYVKYVFFAIFWGTLASLAALPFLIAHPTGELALALSKVWWVWLGFAVVALLTFVRVVRITFLALRLYYKGKKSLARRVASEA